MAQEGTDQFYINREGSFILEPYALITLWPISRLLWACLKLYLVRFTSSAPIYLEYLILFGPFVLGVTLLQNYVYYLVIGLGLITWTLLLRLLISGEPLLRLISDKKVSNALEPRGLLSSLLATLMLSVTVCILCVDFPIFPRRGAKTFDTGFSIMDAGIGAFIAFSGAVSPEAKHAVESSTDRTMQTKIGLLGRTLSSSVPLVVLSCLRLFLIKQFGYREITEEYGTHLNFFAVLAAVKLISCFVYCIIGRSIKLNYVGASVIVAYQLFLNLYAMDNIVNNESRDSFFMANKEGFLSIIGLTGYHLVYTRLHLIIDDASKTHKRYGITQTLKALLRLAAPSIVGLIVMHNFVQPSSRRLSNAAYICWSACMVIFLLGCEVTVNSGIAALQRRYHNVDDLGSKIYRAFSQNAMPLFLLANLLTGAINIVFGTNHMSSWPSLTIIAGYLAFLSAVAYYLLQRNYDIRSTSLVSFATTRNLKSATKVD
jgi:phosphatidylinositol glycan class W